MPRFDKDMDQHNIGGSNFQFSATKIAELGSTEYTLGVLVIDRSGSVSGYEQDIDEAVKAVVQGCRKDKHRVDSMMLMVILFDHEVIEYHGFRPLQDCNEADYDAVCQPRGATALYDAVYNGVNACVKYGQELTDNDFAVNASVFVVTDGEDNRSTVTPKMVAEAISHAKRSEALESLVPVLIGVGYGADDSGSLSQWLQKFKDDAGFQQYIFIKNATPAKIAKLGGFISASISSQSRSLGSGGASKSLAF